MTSGGKRKHAGRAALDKVKTRRVQVLLDDDTIAKAREIGVMTYDRAEISLGLREAVRILYAKYQSA